MKTQTDKTEYKGKKWTQAREKAQAIANKTGATFYAFPEHDGSIAIEIDYPKSGIEFETFKPVSSASVASDSPNQSNETRAVRSKAEIKAERLSWALWACGVYKRASDKEKQQMRGEF